MDTDSQWMTRREVALRYRCSVRTVIRMDKRKEGATPVRVGPRMIRYREADVERYLNGLAEAQDDNGLPEAEGD